MPLLFKLCCFCAQIYILEELISFDTIRFLFTHVSVGGGNQPSWVSVNLDFCYRTFSSCSSDLPLRFTLSFSVPKGPTHGEPDICMCVRMRSIKGSNSQSNQITLSPLLCFFRRIVFIHCCEEDTVCCCFEHCSGFAVAAHSSVKFR